MINKWKYPTENVMEKYFSMREQLEKKLGKSVMKTLLKKMNFKKKVRRNKTKERSV